MTEKFVTLPREVVERTLEALSLALSDVDWRKDSPTQPVIHKAYNATCAAMEQPQDEQKPFAWISPRALEWGTRQSEKVVKLTCKAQPEYDFTEPLYTHPQPQVEQEPVAWMHQCNKRPDLAELSFSKREPALAVKGYKTRPLIFGDIAHPQPKREPLCEDEGCPHHGKTHVCIN